MNTVYIYGLFDPRNLELRYIGRASNPRNRLYRHVHEAKVSTITHKNAWIRGLLNNRLYPAIEVLEECTEENWQEVEQAWIAEAREKGAKLLNVTMGGEGVIGYVFTDEQRKKLSEAQKKRVLSESQKEAQRLRLIQYNKTRIISDGMKKKISEANRGNSYARGTKKSDESKLKMRNAKLGKKMSEETKEKMRKNNSGENNPNFGKVHSDEAREKMRQAQLGRKHTEEHKLKNSLGLKRAYQEGRR